MPSADDFLARLEGDRTLALDLLSALAASVAAHQADVREAWSRGDTDGLRRQVHTLKGMFANMAMDAAAARCVELEAALDPDGSHGDAAARYERLLATVMAAGPAVEELAQRLRQ